MKTLLIYTTLLCSLFISAQQTPALKQIKDFAIVGSTAHIGNGLIIENSIIIVRNGKIDSIDDFEKNSTNITSLDIIDAKGKHVYPGFIAPNSSLGLVEIDAVRASDDASEIGSWNPHIRSLIAYNAESKVVESVRPSGVLLGQITPRSGTISGTSSVVQFDAWNWEDAAVKIDDGIHINWPSLFTRNRTPGSGGNLIANENYAKQVAEMVDYFNHSKAYYKGPKTIKNLPFESLQGLFDGTKKLYVHVDYEKGIIDAINFSKENDVKNMVIVGGREAHKTIQQLKEHNIPVVLMSVHELPNSEDDDYDLPYKLSRILTDNGILVALSVSGSKERMNSRNLPFYAGTAVAHGLQKEQALQLISLNTAKILGIDGSYGSLEKGKSATLFISEGDALDMRTNKITHAFIDGRLISLETHHTELWKRYSEKLNNQ